MFKIRISMWLDISVFDEKDFGIKEKKSRVVEYTLQIMTNLMEEVKTYTIFNIKVINVKTVLNNEWSKWILKIRIYEDNVSTPWFVFCHKVDCNVMNFMYTGQVNRPHGHSCNICYRTLTPNSPQIWFTSIYSIAGLKSSGKRDW